ncbi:hypothetical protein [Catenulispora pinisilvae]|uniref:hypothetical protein n=1 Tax=Catenulispora pinisilvae TaxID=2705253 RepID=UPI0018913DAF|nr:hypothetical protein [Catenulispora pinisilvae]
MRPSYPHLHCEITRWIDDEPQPGIVEAVVVDATDRTWRFVEKVAIVDQTGDAGPTTSYPCPGAIRCEIVDSPSGPGPDAVLLVTTARPDGVEAVDGRTDFLVRASQVTQVAV